MKTHKENYQKWFEKNKKLCKQCRENYICPQSKRCRECQSFKGNGARLNKIKKHKNGN